MKENWFKVTLLLLGVAALGLASTYPYRQKVVEREIEAFRICMNTIRAEVLRDATALKANLSVCKEISQDF